MKTKAEKTTEFIIATVAPIFNKNGYAATSMSTLTSATGLTKGAIYGNFTNKEELAIEAFRFNIKKILHTLGEHINLTNSPLQKLLLLTDFYSNYYDLSQSMGGCPILNIGVDANNQNEKLLKKVRSTITRMEHSLEEIINEGITSGELKPELDTHNSAKQLFTIIEGAIFMTSTMNDSSYIINAMDSTKRMILNQWKK